MSRVNPLLLDIPDRITTERLVLRPLQTGDGPQINEAILESLTELRPWMPWSHSPPSVEDSELHARQSHANWVVRKQLDFLGFQNGRFVLSVGIPRLDWSVPKFEIGYWTRTSATGHGLMTEAVVALTAWTFETLGAQRIEIRCDVKNIGSRRVAERAGYELESIIKNDERNPQGELRDTCVYARIREESP